MRTDTDFDAAWKLADHIPGWLTHDQARLLWDSVLAGPRGAVILEIGSHQGRSTVVLGLAAQSVGGRVIAVDPFVDGRLFGGKATRQSFVDNVEAAGLTGVVELVEGYSTKLRPGWQRPFDLLYVDGKHDYWTFTDDLRWSEHLPSDGVVLVHDSFSSIGVTLGILAKVLAGRRYRYLDRAGSLARFRLGRPSAADRLRCARELPWFVRNVGIKILLRLRLQRVAELLGHKGPYDPY